jgi:protein-S-isoprenylcysteine O-methyltransferase Ste14
MRASTAADIALVLFAIFGVLGFGWRSWIQRQRTGSSGFRGLSGRVGSLEWIAGMGFIVALAVAVSAPILEWTKVVAPLPVLNAVWIQAAGMIIATAGTVGTVHSQLEMGDAWRIGVDERETTMLVDTGVFARVRNPIYTGMFVFIIGMALVTPNFVAFAGFLLLFVSIELQVRRVEEPYLLQKHPDTYRAYAASVGRFVPGIGRLR